MPVIRAISHSRPEFASVIVDSSSERWMYVIELDNLRSPTSFDTPSRTTARRDLRRLYENAECDLRNASADINRTIEQ